MQLIHTIYQPPGAGPYPTILTLHGRGANAFDLLGLAPYVCGGKFLLICPQAPLETPIGPDATGYLVFDEPRRRDGHRRNAVIAATIAELS